LFYQRTCGARGKNRTSNKSANEAFSTNVLVTLSGDFSKGLNGVEVEEVEMTENRVRADFGELDMDWGDDDRYGGLN